MTLAERKRIGEANRVAIKALDEARAQALRDAGERECTRCYVLLPAEWFSPRRSHCRECEVKRVTAYYLRRKGGT